jgi:hypothetical protein
MFCIEFVGRDPRWVMARVQKWSPDLFFRGIVFQQSANGPTCMADGMLKIADDQLIHLL